MKQAEAIRLPTRTLTNLDSDRTLMHSRYIGNGYIDYGYIDIRMNDAPTPPCSHTSLLPPACSR